MNYETIGGRNPIDSRLANKISRSPTMMSEQGSGFMSAYGGVGNYVQFAKMPQNERLVYAARLEGYSNPDEIALVTGLNLTEVNKTLNIIEPQPVEAFK
jgi:hypothetical protein